MTGNTCVNQGAISTQNGAEAAVVGVGHKIEDVITQERFTAAENHNPEAGGSDLFDQSEALRSAQFILLFGSRVTITVFTGLIAGPGGVP